MHLRIVVAIQLLLLITIISAELGKTATPWDRVNTIDDYYHNWNVSLNNFKQNLSINLYQNARSLNLSSVISTLIFRIHNAKGLRMPTGGGSILVELYGESGDYNKTITYQGGVEYVEVSFTNLEVNKTYTISVKHTPFSGLGLSEVWGSEAFTLTPIMATKPVDFYRSEPYIVDVSYPMYARPGEQITFKITVRKEEANLWGYKRGLPLSFSISIILDEDGKPPFDYVYNSTGYFIYLNDTKTINITVSAPLKQGRYMPYIVLYRTLIACTPGGGCLPPIVFDQWDGSRRPIEVQQQVVSQTVNLTIRVYNAYGLPLPSGGGKLEVWLSVFDKDCKIPIGDAVGTAEYRGGEKFVDVVFNVPPGCYGVPNGIRHKPYNGLMLEENWPVEMKYYYGSLEFPMPRAPDVVRIRGYATVVLERLFTITNVTIKYAEGELWANLTIPKPASDRIYWDSYSWFLILDSDMRPPYDYVLRSGESYYPLKPIRASVKPGTYYAYALVVYGPTSWTSVEQGGGPIYSQYGWIRVSLGDTAQPPAPPEFNDPRFLQLLRYVRDKVKLYAELFNPRFYSDKSEEYRKAVYEKAQELLKVDTTSVIKDIAMDIASEYLPPLTYYSYAETIIKAFEVVGYILLDLINQFHYYVFSMFNWNTTGDVSKELIELADLLDNIIKSIENRDVDKYKQLKEELKNKIDSLVNVVQNGEETVATWLGHEQTRTLNPYLYRGPRLKLNRMVGDLLVTLDLIYIPLYGESIDKIYTLDEREDSYAPTDLPIVLNFTWYVNGVKSYVASEGDHVKLVVNITSKPFRRFQCGKLKVVIYKDIAFWLDETVKEVILDLGDDLYRAVTVTVDFVAKRGLLLRGYKFRAYAWGCSYPLPYREQEEKWIPLIIVPQVELLSKESKDSQGFTQIVTYPPGLKVSDVESGGSVFPAVVQMWGESCVDAVQRGLSAIGLSLGGKISLESAVREVARGMPVVVDFVPNVGEGHRVVLVGAHEGRLILWDPSGALLNYSLGTARVGAYAEPLFYPYLYLLDREVLEKFPGTVVFYRTVGSYRNAVVLAKSGAIFDRYVDPNATFWIWSTGGVDVELSQVIGGAELKYRPELVSTQKLNGGWLYEFKWGVEPLVNSTLWVSVNGTRYGPFVVFPSPKVYNAKNGTVYLSGRYAFAYFPRCYGEIDISVAGRNFVLRPSEGCLSELIKLPDVGEVKIDGVSTARYVGRIDWVFYDLATSVVYVYAAADAVLINGKGATLNGGVWVGKAQGTVKVESLVEKRVVDSLVIEPGVVSVNFSSHVAPRSTSQIAYVNYTGFCRVKVEGRGDIVVSKASSTLYSSSYVYGNVKRDNGTTEVGLELIEECWRYAVKYFFKGNVSITRTEAPIAVVLVVDKSGSMDDVDGGVKRIDAAKNAARILIDEVAKLGGYIGLIAFDNKPYVLTTLTKNYTSVKRLVDSIKPGGSTNIGDSIIEAAELLKDFGGRPLIVLITDGEHNTGTPPEDAVSKIPKIPVFTIGLGSESAHDQLRLVARATGGYYLYSPTARELASVFARLIGMALGTSIYNGTSNRLALDLSLYDDVEIVLNWTDKPDVAVWIPRRTVGQVGIVQAEKVPLSQLCGVSATCSESGAVIRGTNLPWIGIESNTPIQVRATSSTPSARLVKVAPGEVATPGSTIYLSVESPYTIRGVRSELQCQKIDDTRYACHIPTKAKEIYDIRVYVAGGYIQLGIPTPANTKEEDITIRVVKREVCNITIQGPSRVELNGLSTDVIYSIIGTPGDAVVNVYIDPTTGTFWSPIRVKIGGRFLVTFTYLGGGSREYRIVAGCLERGGAGELTVVVSEAFQPALPLVDKIEETVTVGVKKNVTIPLSGRGEAKVVNAPKWAEVRKDGDKLVVTLALDKPGVYEGELVVESSGVRKSVAVRVEALSIAALSSVSTKMAEAELTLEGIRVYKEGRAGLTTLAIVDPSAVDRKLPGAVKYFDLYSERAWRVVMTVNAPKAGLALYWFNGTNWRMLARSDNNMIVFEINGTSIPNVGQLGGTLFAVAPPVLKGDLNGNGVLDVGDVVLLLKMVAEGKYDYAADVNDNGEVDIGDVVALLQLIAKD